MDNRSIVRILESAMSLRLNLKLIGTIRKLFKPLKADMEGSIWR